MISHRIRTPLSILCVFLALLSGGTARAQVAFGVTGYPTVGGFGLGYEATPFGGFGAAGTGWDLGSNPFSVAGYGTVGGYGISPYGYGYGIGNGEVTSGYQPSIQLNYQGFHPTQPQTTQAWSPLFDAVTSVPGWNAPAQRRRRRLHSQSSPAPVRTLDDHGKILWPSTIPEDSADAALQRTVEEAVRSVVAESKSTGHASVRPVIEAKKKVEAFERKVLPMVRRKNPTDAAAVDAFFFHLKQALDQLTNTF
jgi:hypothetical protein